MTLNRYLGSSPVAECRVPAGALVCEMKYCEVCGRAFVRELAPTAPVAVRESDVNGTYCGKVHYGATHVAIRRRDHGQRFCKSCRSRSLEPDVAAQAQYKEQLPTEREGRKNRVYSMPDYRYLNPAYPAQRAPNARRGLPRQETLRRAEEARAAIAQAFLKKAQLNLEELQAILPNCYRSTDVHPRLKGLKVEVMLVGREKREGIRGSGMGIYALVPPTIH